jgi:uncharacterized protein YbjT (DUF2867 family)
MIHPDDIADVTTQALLSRDDEGRILPFSGPEALTYAEMTAKLGTALGRPLVFESMSDLMKKLANVSWRSKIRARWPRRACRSGGRFARAASRVSPPRSGAFSGESE